MNTPSGLLAIDIGNTNIYLGLWQNDNWQLSWRARTVAEKMSDEYAVLVRNFLSSAGMSNGDISGVIISCVVPRLTATFTELIQRYYQVEPVVLTHSLDLGIQVDIDQPEQAGADRLANAVALSFNYGGPAFAVDFGTSTNFDVISSEGNYIGGAIAPGITLAHDALVGRAAKLHKVDLVPPPHPVGRNTIHAIQSGVVWGYIGLVEGVVKRIKDSFEGEIVKVIATGGLAPLFSEYTTVIDKIDSELTLEGLRIIYERNCCT